MEREIIYADITSFAVTVERIIHPELRTRPVVVAPATAPRSVVTALSNEAWRAGIRKGMPLTKAKRYCRGLTVLPPNEPLYARASEAVCRVLGEFSPLWETAGYGHTFLDITGTGRLFGPSRDTAWRAQKEIRRRLRLEASFGLASNKMVSRIAAVVHKPVGLGMVRPGDEETFLLPLPVRLLPGVGDKTRVLLEDLNIRVVRELRAVGKDALLLAFGRFGLLLERRSRGIDNTPVYPRGTEAVIEESATPAEDSNDYDLLRRVLAGMCARAVERLRHREERAGRMNLHLRYSDGRDVTKGIRLVKPAQTAAELRASGEWLLRRIMVRRTRVRNLYLRLSELKRGPFQLDLFPHSNILTPDF